MILAAESGLIPFHDWKERHVDPTLILPDCAAAMILYSPFSSMLEFRYDRNAGIQERQFYLNAKNLESKC